VIPNVKNLKAGTRGRNFESFTGLRTTIDEDTGNEKTQKVLVKLYKRLPLAKIDEAEN
jgi:hypothetical protein